MPAFVALVLTATLVPPLTAVLRRLQVVDQPNPRSSHDRTTVRGGGIAPAVGGLLALVTTSAVEPRTARLVLGVTAALFALIGLVDDLHGLDPAPRVGLLGGAAAIVAVLVSSLLDWQLVAVGLTALWLVSFVNAFNFMDGINGISCATAAVAGMTWWVIGRVEDVPLLAGGGAVVAAAAIGFAPYNFPRARLFLGDVGSYFLGAWLAVLAALGIEAGVPPEALLAPLTLYLADTGTTLTRRVLRGDRWWEAHREHAYQRLVGSGWSHARTTALVTAATLLTAALGMLALTDSVALRVAGDVTLLAVVAVYLWVGGHRPVAPPAPDRARDA